MGAAGTKVDPADMMVSRGASSMLGEAHFVFNLSDISKREAEDDSRKKADR